MTDHLVVFTPSGRRGRFEAGTTVLVTTHYMDEAEYCDRISIMVAGRIGAIGTPADLKKQFGVDSIDELFVRLARPTAGTTPNPGSPIPDRGVAPSERRR